MRRIFANLVAIFIPSREIRRRVRHKILSWKLSNLNKKKKYRQLKSEWFARSGILLPARFKEYDLIIPMGATCHVSWLLKAFKLRSFSMPFEWTGGAEPVNWYVDPFVQRNTRFREKIDAICNDFKDFYNPDDFRQITDWNPGKKHHMVVNVKTKIRFMHAFPAKQSFESYMPDFIDKTKRRSERLMDAIKMSDKILFCWIHKTWDQNALMDAIVDDRDIKHAIKALKKKYPNKEFDFVFFEQDGTKKRFEFEKKPVSNCAFRIKSNHFLFDSEYETLWPFDDKFHSHIHVVSEMLDNIKLSKKIKNG